MKSQLYPGISDEQLISGLLNGDRNCSGILYGRYYSKVYSKCYSFSRNRDDAFDMTQDILLKALCNVSSFVGNSKFSTWLYVITVNYCITHSGRNSRKYHEDINAAHQIPEERMDDEVTEERERWEAMESSLDEYLQMLTNEERQMLVLKYLMNFSVKELQKEFDLSASAVKMRLLRARMKMNQIINLRKAA